jgi:hypothetical protein
LNNKQVVNIHSFKFLTFRGKNHLIFLQVLFMSFFSLFSFRDVWGANWDLLPRLATGVQYTDNLFFTFIDDEKVSDTKLVIVPAIIFRGESDRNLATVEAGVNLERYNKTKEADRNDPYLYFDWEHNWEYHTFGLGIQYWQSSTRTSELETTGRSNIYGTRTNTSLNPQWQSSIGENDTIILGLAFLDVFYDLPSLIDYQDYSFSIQWNHELSPLNTTYLTTIGNSYNADAIGLDYNYGQILVGLTSQRSEQLRYDMSLGMGYADRKIQADYRTWLANISLTNEREYDETTLSFSSQLVPTGSGDLRKIYAFDFQYRRDMSLNLDFTFQTRYTDSESVNELSQERVKYLTVRPGLTYQLDENWFIETWYQYLINRYLTNDPIEENSFYLGIRYDIGL